MGGVTTKKGDAGWFFAAFMVLLAGIALWRLRTTELSLARLGYGNNQCCEHCPTTWLERQERVTVESEQDGRGGE